VTQRKFAKRCAKVKRGIQKGRRKRDEEKENTTIQFELIISSVSGEAPLSLSYLSPFFIVNHEKLPPFKLEE
jgi:hypothetical protein